MRSFSCCSLFLALFSSVDMALNPLGLSRLEIKLQVREIQDQLELISQQQTLLDQNYIFIARRLENLEDIGSKMEGDLGKLQKVLDHNTATLKTLTPVLASED